MLIKIEKAFFLIIHTIMVLVLAGMAIMVFGNVVMRYFFNSGWNVSAELSRYMFIWLTFFGAISVLYDRGHLGVDTFVRRMKPRGQAIAISISYILMMAVCVILFIGLAMQHDANMGRSGMITGIPLEIVNAPAYICAVSMFIILAVRIVRFWRKEATLDDLLANMEELPEEAME